MQRGCAQGWRRGECRAATVRGAQMCGAAAARALGLRDLVARGVHVHAVVAQLARGRGHGRRRVVGLEGEGDLVGRAHHRRPVLIYGFLVIGCGGVFVRLGIRGFDE